MEVVKKMNVPATFLYEKIIDSVLFDIRKATGNSMKPKKLDGYEYVKTFSKDSRAKIRIDKVVENEFYSFTTSTVRNEFKAQYEITPIDEKHCELRYTEDMVSNGTIQRLNDALVGFMAKFLKKRQFKKMLTLIEDSY